MRLLRSIRIMCDTFAVEFDNIPDSLARLDQEVSKFNDSEASRSWSYLSSSLETAYDQLSNLGFFTIDMSQFTTTSDPIFEFENEYLYFLSSSEPVPDTMIDIEPTIIVLPDTLNHILRNYHRDELPKYRVLIKTGVMLHALTNGHLTDSLWKKVMPFIYDGIRYEGVSSFPPQQFPFSQTWKGILTEHELQSRNISSLLNKYWASQVSSPCIGYIADIRLYIDIDWGNTDIQIRYNDEQHLVRELQKPHWIFSISLIKKKYAHRNCIIFTNNTFFYIEPHGSDRGDGNAYLKGDFFRKMWKDLITRICRDLIGKASPLRLSRFIPSNQPFVLLSDRSLHRYRWFQYWVEFLNESWEKGGYCVIIALFIVELFRLNACSTVFDQDSLYPPPQKSTIRHEPFPIKPWTAEQMTIMVELYIIISMMTGQLQPQLKGFEVAIFRRIKTLQRLESSQLKDSTPPSRSQRRPAATFKHTTRQDTNIPLQYLRTEVERPERSRRIQHRLNKTELQALMARLLRARAQRPSLYRTIFGQHMNPIPLPTQILHDDVVDMGAVQRLARGSSDPRRFREKFLEYISGGDVAQTELHDLLRRR